MARTSMAKSSASTFQGCGNEGVENLVRALHRDVRRFVTSLGCRSRVCRRLEPGRLHAGPGQPAPLRRSLRGPHLLLRVARRTVVDHLRNAATSYAARTPTADRLPPSGPGHTTCPASTTALRSSSCWPTCSTGTARREPRDVRPPSYWGCPTRKRRRSATAQWGPCVRESRARTSLIAWLQDSERPTGGRRGLSSAAGRLGPCVTSASKTGDGLGGRRRHNGPGDCP